MLRPVAVGFDGSRESLAAAHWAAREALRRGLPLRLVQAYEPRPGGRGGSVVDTRALRVQGRLRLAEANLRQCHPRLVVAPERPGVPAPQALLDVAERSEMLVLGSRGHGGVTGFLLGSVGLATAARAASPVVFVRSSESSVDEHFVDEDGLPSVETPYRDVVLGLDLRRPCDELLRFAFETAAARGGGLHAVYAWHLPAEYGYEAGPLVERTGPRSGSEAAQALTGTLQRWCAKFPQVTVVEQVTAGRASRALLRAASEAGLLVVGRSARRSVIGTRLGPVAHMAIHHARCPVAVVPHD
ncbi:universal stress protein [Streptomyces buecherae]|uniref:universal stress protein n=1 Tax=Streptomyces buecherae TaxID=2763006 RepID=UPI0036A29362